MSNVALPAVEVFVGAVLAPPLIHSVTSEKGVASTALMTPDTELCPRGRGHWS